MEVPRGDRDPAPRWLLHVAGVAAAVTVLAILVIDQPLARTVGAYEPLALWDRGIDFLEYFILYPVHPLALPFVLVVAMLTTMAVKAWRSAAPAAMWLAGTHIVSRYAVGWLKDGTDRVRPIKWKGGDSFFEGGSAFPSGHVTLFGSIIIAIAVLVPKARIPAFVVLAFIACARIGVSAHWLSDTTSALALTALVAYGMGLALRPLHRR